MLGKIILTTDNLSEVAVEMMAAFGDFKRLIEEAEEGTTVTVPQETIDEASGRARKAALVIIGYKGDWPDDVDLEETRLNARKVIRVVGALEPISAMGRSDHPDMMEDDPRSKLPEKWRDGRRTYEFALGYNLASESTCKDELTEEACDRMCGILNPYPPETFRSSEFKGGWNEYMRSIS